MKKAKVTAVLIINSDGQYNICGWNIASDSEDYEIEEMFGHCQECVIFQDATIKKYILTTEVEIPEEKIEILTNINVSKVYE